MKLASATWLGPPLRTLQGRTLQGPDFGRACADLMRLVEVDYAPTLIIGIRTGGLVVAQAMADAASPRLPVLPLTCRRVTTAAKSRLPLLRTLLGILPRPVVNQLRRLEHRIGSSPRVARNMAGGRRSTTRRSRRLPIILRRSLRRHAS